VRISIIVPAFNEERLLPATLASVKDSLAVVTAAGWEAELIVCDNNSTDRTAELARGAGATVVFEPINQIGRARNRGAEAATGDWLLFVDADSQPSRELFQEMLEAIRSRRYLAGGATVRLDEHSDLGSRVVGLWNAVSRSCRLLAGSFIFCEAKAFRTIGGFSPELFAGEELELSQKLKRLARQQKKKLIILYRHPLITSARKVRLYRPGEFLWLMVKIVVARRRVLSDRAQCYHWYDGRR
jgi:glycosyltransferase involved in cell wall biosynthesis